MLISQSYYQTLDNAHKKINILAGGGQNIQTKASDGKN